MTKTWLNRFCLCMLYSCICCCLMLHHHEWWWLPWSSSSWAVVKCPSEAAVIRAVRPCWSTMFTSTPWFSNNSTTWPRDADVDRLYNSVADIKPNRCLLCVCVFCVVQRTCQWSRLTALKSGATPRRLPCSTAAPWSSNSLQTASRPLPAAAVRADTDTQTEAVGNRFSKCECVS